MGDDPVNKTDPSGEDFGDSYFQTSFSLSAGSALSAFGPKGTRISDLLKGDNLTSSEEHLSNQYSDEGIIERLFISEIRNPSYRTTYSQGLAVASMRLLGALIRNRIKQPGWPKDVWGVITDSNPVEQFKGFSTYPPLPAEQGKMVNDVVNAAFNPSHYLYHLMNAYVSAVKNVASQTASGAISDPYNGRTIYMRTAGHGKPTPKSKPLITLMDNTFYSEK